MIPTQLQQKGIKFVLLEKSGKRPFQKEWQNKIIEYDNDELVFHINNGGNYGVMGGGEKGLVIIDFDNEDVQNKVCSKLPNTFTVKTGSGKLHKYFFSDNTESFKIFDGEMNTIADVQGEGKQVVAPNSVHPNGNKYEVLDAGDINFIPYSEIKALLFPYDSRPKKEKKELERPKGISTDDFVQTLQNRISMKDVLESFGVNTSMNPTSCPFHESRGGKCLGFTYQVAHCFHCDGAWNVFSLVKEKKNCDFKESLQYLANLCGLQEELELSKRQYLETLKDSEQYERKMVRSEFLELVSGKEKKWSQATEILAEYVKKKLHIYTTKEDLKSEMWIYEDGIYIPQGKSEVKVVLRELLGEWYSQYIYGLVIAKLEPDTFIGSNIFFNNIYRNEVVVQNGILNILTREIKPFTHEKIFFAKLPVEYNPNAQCPKIDKFLSDIFPFEDDKKVYYEIGGFTLLNEYTYEKAFMFLGKGRNGKDKSIELYKRLLGVENCSSIPLVSLDPESFAISELFMKKANLAGEIGNQDLKDTTTFKALTGRTLMSAKRKFMNTLSFVNHAKFIFACNDLPMVYDLNKGFWDRWVLLEFPYSFVTQQELDENEDNTFFKLRDEDIISKITTPEEMSGLLNKFIDGLARLEMNKNFSATQGSEEVKSLWIKKSNSFIAFCFDNLEDDFESRVSKKELKKRYSIYCKENKVQAKSDFVIKRFLSENYGVDESQDSSDWGIRYWEGIKWKVKT